MQLGGHHCNERISSYLGRAVHIESHHLSEDMDPVSREDCAKIQGELNVKLAEMHQDVKWIKSSLQNGESWMTKHEDEHKTLTMKLIGAVVILTGAVAAFFGAR